MNTAPILQWIESQPDRSLATIAAAVARFGCLLPAILTDCRERWPGSPPDPAAWIKLYRDHRRIAEAVHKSLCSAPDCELLGDTARWLRALSPELRRWVADSITPEDWAAGVRIGEEQARVFQEAMAAVAFNDVPTARALGASVGELSVEGRFFMQVELPYLVEYGDLPIRDFADARRGDVAALERLLAIDPAVVGDAEIAGQIARSVLSRNMARMRLLSGAMVKGPPVVKAEQCKILVAAAIVGVFENAGVAITVASVRSLFDAIARSERDVLIDSDLPYSPEAMSKGIQRYKKFWRRIIDRVSGRHTGQNLR
jgi:hypothetical protein